MKNLIEYKGFVHYTISYSREYDSTLNFHVYKVTEWNESKEIINLFEFIIGSYRLNGDIELDFLENKGRLSFDNFDEFDEFKDMMNELRISITEEIIYE